MANANNKTIIQTQSSDATTASVIEKVGATEVAETSSTQRTMSVPIVADDHGIGSTAQVPNFVYGSGTAPTASTTPEGTIWAKFTP